MLFLLSIGTVGMTKISRGEARGGRTSRASLQDAENIVLQHPQYGKKDAWGRARSARPTFTDNQ